MAGEAPSDGHSMRPHTARRVDVGFGGPCQGRFDSDRWRGGGVEVGDEAGQEPPVLGEVMAETATQRQVFGGGDAERAHGWPPGQGWATARSEARSTLA